MPRKPRKDIRIGNLEKKFGLPPGSIKNPDGSDARSDKKLGTLQREGEKVKKAKAAKKKSPTAKSTVKKKPATAKKEADKKAVSKPTTIDQKKASKRKVRSNPKTTSKLAKKVRSAIKKSTK